MRARRIDFPVDKAERDRLAPGLWLCNVCSFSLSYNPSPVPCCASLFDSVDLARVGGVADRTAAPVMARHRGEGSQRSEEHTSELQSLMRISYAVFCLKKKKKTNKSKSKSRVMLTRGHPHNGTTI